MYVAVTLSCAVFVLCFIHPKGFVYLQRIKASFMGDDKGNLIVNILKEKCPHCGKGQVFEKKSLFQFPVMKKNCEVCAYKFDREPGYFLGAMYLSYGLAVLQGILTFLVFYFFFPSVDVLYVAFAMVGVIMLCALKNFKLSRIIYIHIFPW
jgi:uncharacterized protein (DUF983 family)